MTAGDVEGLAHSDISEGFDGLEADCLALADAMSELPAEVDQNLYARITNRLGPSAMVELVAAIAWENYRARFNRAFDVQSDQFDEADRCPLPTATRRAVEGSHRH